MPAKIWHTYTPSTMAVLMTTLHSKLIEAGWTIMWADTDAIGTGSASDPAWDKAVTASTYAGDSIYRSAGATPFYVRLRGYWGATPSQATYLFVHGAISATWDGVSALTNGSTLAGAHMANSTNAATLNLAIGDDYLGFSHATAHFGMIAFERLLDPEGALSSNLAHWQKAYHASLAVVGFSSVNVPKRGGGFVSGGGVFTEVDALQLAIGNTGTNNFQATTTLRAPGGLIEFPSGPYFLTVDGVRISHAFHWMSAPDNPVLNTVTTQYLGGTELRKIRSSVMIADNFAVREP